MDNAILRTDDALIAQAALSYVVFTTAFGAALTVLTSLRFPTSQRRICAAWGVTAAIALLLLGALMVGWLMLLGSGSPGLPTERQILARNARYWLPAITLLTYVAALAWGLLSPVGPLTALRRLVRLAVVPVMIAMPSAAVAAWFVWRA